MPTEEKSKRNMRVLAPVAIGVAMSAALVVVALIGAFPYGREFKSTTIVEMSDWENFSSSYSIDSVAGITGLDPVAGKSSTSVYLELPVVYNQTYANNLKTQLVALGIPENTIYVSELAPLVSPAQVLQIGAGMIGALVVISILSLLFYRSRRIAWGAPLIIGMGILEIIGVFSMAQLSFGLFALFGILIVFMQSITLNVVLIHRLSRTEGWDKKTRELSKVGGGVFAGILMMAGVLALFTRTAQLVELFVVVLLGMLFNILNTSWLNAEIFAKKTHVEKVEYHVSL